MMIIFNLMIMICIKFHQKLKKNILNFWRFLCFKKIPFFFKAIFQPWYNEKVIVYDA